jgi:hypothetical protein
MISMAFWSTLLSFWSKKSPAKKGKAKKGKAKKGKAKKGKTKKGKTKKGQGDVTPMLNGIAAVGLTASVVGAAATSGAVFYNPGHGAQPPTQENFFATGAFISTGMASLGMMVGTSFMKK